MGEREDSPERGSSKSHRPPLMACHGSRNPEVGGFEGPRGYEDPLSLLKENLSLDHLQNDEDDVLNKALSRAEGESSLKGL